MQADSKDGRFATLPSLAGHQRRVDDKWLDTIPGIGNDPAGWLRYEWWNNGNDVRVDDRAGRVLCPAGGSRMMSSIIDHGAQAACQMFVSKSRAGQLGLQVWHAWEQWGDGQLTTADGHDGYIRWLIGSVSDSPTELTQEFCENIWDAVKNLCSNDAGATQGQAVSVGDWTIYADPNEKASGK
ncbi:uncharacterized protein JN550_008413 [Neoarthrinium moseri]|uniref:uncharacterized protein n=1 Tax=Neoarthrinium moseri TaxID=1658444 RepID=UPI001FDC30DD|nr:uncharacterized protein JN550_008413 [Neoarthrinium moseri]KAI1865365.1 hypothetical protein JN550_008413 [Neoarthrinium moseri]